MELLDGIEYLLVQEAAALKGITPQGVYGAIRSGRVPVRKIGKSVLVTASDIQAWEPAGHGGKRPGQGRKKRQEALTEARE